MANPFDIDRKIYIAFPNDEYIDACILSYQIADLPPGPMSNTNDPVKSTRFLFGGHIKDENGNLRVDENGNPIVVRKWTNWMRLSNSERSAMMQTFTGFDNLFDILQDCQDDKGKLWNTAFKIILEQKDKFQNILRIKPGANTDLVKNCFYDDKYIPYKVIKAYGKLQALSLAGCKFKSGVKTFTPDEMVDPTDENTPS